MIKIRFNNWWTNEGHKVGHDGNTRKSIAEEAFGAGFTGGLDMARETFKLRMKEDFCEVLNSYGFKQQGAQPEDAFYDPYCTKCGQVLIDDELVCDACRGYGKRKHLD